MKPEYGTYAAPKPVFGRGCLFALLGCLGVSLLAVLAMAVLVAPRIKEAAKGEKVLSSTLRTYLPSDIPLYPGLSLNEQQTNSAWMALRLIQSFGKDIKDRPPRQFVFTAPVEAATVITWYQTEMPKAGWKGARRDENLGGLMRIKMAMFRKGERVLMLQTVQMDPKQLTMMYFERLPKPGPGEKRDPDDWTP